MNISDIIWFVVFAVASLLHGIAGLGVTLITTTALASEHEFAYAIVLSLFPALVLNAMSWLYGGGTMWHNFMYYLHHYWLLAVMSFIGSVLGAMLIVWINANYLMMLLAMVVGFYVLMDTTGRQIQLSATRSTLIVVGLFAGIIGGATNAMSSVLLMYLLSVSDDKHTIAKVGNMCYLLSKIAQIIVLKDNILALSIGTWGVIVGLTVVSVLFLMLGIRLRYYLPQRRFRQLILLILTLLGIKVGWQGLAGLMA